MKSFLLGIAAVTIIGALLFGAYRYGKESKNQTGLSSVPSITQVPPSPTFQTASPSISQTQSLTDDELIIQALYKKNNWPANTVNIKVKTNDGKYASGSVNSQGGGGLFFAVKANGIWEIIADGNGIIPCGNVMKYPDFPKNIIPECWDTETNQLMKR